MRPHANSKDVRTAKAFSDSWTHCYSASPYTPEQIREWFAPVDLTQLKDLEICEMGCGNGGLLQHVAKFSDKQVTAVELGDSIESAKTNLTGMGITNVEFVKEDINVYAGENPDRFDFVYCIGVLHHMDNPEEGFKSVVTAAKKGARVHCWVYAHEGNYIVRSFVDPLRRVASKLPWWFNKYALALPLSVPFYMCSQAVRLLGRAISFIPLYEYFKWISSESFSFHHHVAFDQLVSTQTTYIKKETVLRWLDEAAIKDRYVIYRNSNSWKFGGIKP